MINEQIAPAPTGASPGEKNKRRASGFSTTQAPVATAITLIWRDCQLSAPPSRAYRMGRLQHSALAHDRLELQDKSRKPNQPRRDELTSEVYCERSSL